MPARRVTHQEKEAMSLEAAAFLFAPEVAGSCDDFWVSITPEGEPLPQTDEERIVAIGRWLTKCRERTVEADDAHDEALRQRHQVVSERDVAATKLRETILEIRRNFEGVYGQGKTGKILGLVPNIDEEAVRLKRYARAAVKLMEQPGYELPEPESQVASIQAADVVAKITPVLETVEGFVAIIDSAKRFVQTTLKEKVAAAEALERANGLAARYLEGLFRLVGEDFLADRLRQSSHLSSPAEPDDDSGDTPGVQEAAEVPPPAVDDIEPPAALAADLDEPDGVGSVALQR